MAFGSLKKLNDRRVIGEVPTLCHEGQPLPSGELEFAIPGLGRKRAS